MSESSYRRYVLGQLRMARVRAKLLINEIDTIGKALRGGLVDPDVALTWLTGDAISLVQCEPAATIEYEATHANVGNRMAEDRTQETDQADGELRAQDDGETARRLGASAA
jgi:hypothetical protein